MSDDASDEVASQAFKDDDSVAEDIETSETDLDNEEETTEE